MDDAENDGEDSVIHEMLAPLRREVAPIGRAFRERVLRAMEEVDRARELQAVLRQNSVHRPSARS